MDLAPCAVLCPTCLGLLFIDTSSNASRYQDADIEGTLGDDAVVVGYATYPDHPAQDFLHEKITRSTNGGRVLVAMRLDDELAEMLGITQGQITTIPSSCDETELSSMLPAPSALADHISKLALDACQQGRFWEAVALAQRAMVIEPEWALAHFSLGSALDELGMLERAVEAYQDALRLHPRFPEAHLNLGLVCERQARWADAISHYQAALRINPDYADAHYNLGVVYGHQGRVEDEIREYQAAVWSNPEHAVARHNLGITYYQQGREDEALRELRVAASLGFPPAKQFLAHIGYAR
jgi:tetratricopeptide (TPR) repeat protein